MLRKYRLLAAWRAGKDATHHQSSREGTLARAAADAGAEPHALRELAREFPGALRELDLLGLPEMLRRIDLLEREEELAQATVAVAVTVVSPPLWVGWILAYHAAMRAALHIKRLSGPARRPLSGVELERALGAARDHCPLPTIDEAFVHSAISPPAGRLNLVVIAALARHFETPAAEISRTLFPPRRAPPYAWP